MRLCSLTMEPFSRDGVLSLDQHASRRWTTTPRETGRSETGEGVYLLFPLVSKQGQDKLGLFNGWNTHTSSKFNNTHTRTIAYSSLSLSLSLLICSSTYPIRQQPDQNQLLWKHEVYEPTGGIPIPLARMRLDRMSIWQEGRRRRRARWKKWLGRSRWLLRFILRGSETSSLRRPLLGRERG